VSNNSSGRGVSRRRVLSGFLGAALAPRGAAQPAPVAGAAATPCTGGALPRTWRGTLPMTPVIDAAVAFQRNDVTPKVRPFSLSCVELTDGPFAAAAAWNVDYLERLSPERLVHNFRVNANLPTSARPLGGWEAPNVELRGHFTGHFLSACALQSASGAPRLRERGEFVVEELARCQRTGSTGYVSAFPLEFLDRLAAGREVWAPFYTLHKIMAGLLDMRVLAGSQRALEVLVGMAEWVDGWTAAQGDARLQGVLQSEFGGMNAVLYDLAAVTGDVRWARVGDRFTKREFFNPLAARSDALRGLHANTHIPQVIGAARRYELSGDPRFRTIAEFFWQAVATARSYATGGTGNAEGWLTQPGMLAAELARSVNTAECCCAYNMLKLTRHLYSWCGDSRYFDYYERLLWNHRLGTIRPERGYTQYYLSLAPSAWRSFSTEEDSFWCCTGTGIEEFSKLSDSIYWHDQKSLYVNLFIPSRLQWRECGLTLEQRTRFPEGENTELRLSLQRPRRFRLCLRVPSWVAGSAQARINGRPCEGTASPGSYLAIERVWRTGDTVQLSLPMELRTEGLPDDPGLLAFVYGPLVLAGDLGAEALTRDLIVGPPGPRLQAAAPIEPWPGNAPPPVPPIPVPLLRRDAQATKWARSGGRGLEFTLHTAMADVTLKPFYKLLDRRYNVYWRVA
jgi:uncharacterized protein